MTAIRMTATADVAPLDALALRIAAAAAAAMDVAAEVVATEAARRAGGRLGETIVAEAGGVVITRAPYAAYVEQGTRRRRARPFLAPALAATEPVILRIVADAVGAAVR